MDRNILIPLSGVIALAAMAACGSVTSSTGGDAGTDAGTDGAIQPDPADAAVDAQLSWSPFELVNVDFGGQTMTPSVSADGLTLYFTAYVGGSGSDVFDIYFATRESPSSGFAAAAPLPVVNVPNQQQRYLEISHDGLELYFSQGDIGPIMLSTRPTVSADWGTPMQVGVSGNFPSISGDKRSLYYITQTTGANGELKRITRAAPGQPWSIPTSVPLPGAIEIYSAIDISHDELSILRAPPLAIGAPTGDILIGRRQSRADPFEDFEVLATVDTANTAFMSARWNADDTEIWIGQAVSSMERPFVSRLR